MQRKFVQGAPYRGKIYRRDSGISNYVFYVELPNTVEGMVRLANLDGDYYVFDEEHYELVGERTRKKFKLGQTVKIQVVSVDRYLKTIDFLPVRNFDKR